MSRSPEYSRRVGDIAAALIPELTDRKVGCKKGKRAKKGTPPPRYNKVFKADPVPMVNKQCLPFCSLCMLAHGKSTLAAVLDLVQRFICTLEYFHILVSLIAAAAADADGQIAQGILL